VRRSRFRSGAQRLDWKLALLRRQKYRCALCGCRFPDERDPATIRTPAFEPTFDHIVPRSFGGSDTFENLQIAHGTCNKQKGNAIVPIVPMPMPRLLRRELQPARPPAPSCGYDCGGREAARSAAPKHVRGESA
jgi:5-methylcytosine-specific restriction endonuclease McrA